MAQKIPIDFDVDEIKALIQARLAATPALSPLRGGAIGQLYRVAQERAQTPAGDVLAQQQLNLREQSATQTLSRQLQRAQASPFQQAVEALHVGAGIGGGGAGGIAGMLGTVGQFARVLGAANPELVAAAAAVALLTKAALDASKTLTNLAQGSLVTGSTPGQFAFARALGGAAGVSPEGMGGMLQALRQRIATDPMAMAAAGQFGVRALPQGFGLVPNMAAMFQQLFQGMRNMPQAQAQQMGERIPEMQPFLAIAQKGSAEQIQRIQKLAEQFDRLATPEATRRAIDLSLAQQELSLSWQELTTALGENLIPAITSVVNLINRVLEHSGKGGVGFGKVAADFLGGQFVQAFSDVKEMLGGGKKTSDADRHAKTQQDHAQAMREHAEEMRLTRHGVFGGGQRAQSAIPPGLRGEALEQALRAQAVRLGAF